MVLYDELKDLRKNPRKTFSKLIFFSSQNKYYEGVIKNLSRGGDFIETKARLSNRIELKLVLPRPDKYILLKGEIIHFKQTGFGVKLKSLLEVTQDKRYVAKLTV